MSQPRLRLEEMFHSLRFPIWWSTPLVTMTTNTIHGGHCRWQLSKTIPPPATRDGRSRPQSNAITTAKKIPMTGASLSTPFADAVDLGWLRFLELFGRSFSSTFCSSALSILDSHHSPHIPDATSRSRTNVLEEKSPRLRSSCHHRCGEILGGST